jgi:tRNA A64-2'-O-ribosylphosphate transferase
MVLVDSTKSGKRMPDALSKTVPIWCAVIISSLFPDLTDPLNGWGTDIYTPPGVVSQQEHYQIQTRLDDWAKSLIVCPISVHE